MPSHSSERHGDVETPQRPLTAQQLEHFEDPGLALCPVTATGSGESAGPV